VVEDQQALIIIQNFVVVRQALIIAHIVEGIESRNTRPQNPLGHGGLQMPLIPEFLYVLSE